MGYGIIGHIESIGVHPNARGNGLQIKMLSEIEPHAKKRKLVYLFATVSKKNKVSRDNFKKMGYTQICEKDCYNGCQRIVISKKIRKIWLC